MLVKKVFYNPLLKIIAFIVAVALLTNCFLLTIKAVRDLEYPETILNSRYQDSYELQSRVLSKVSTIYRLLSYYRSEDYIIDGGTLSDNYRYDSRLSNLYEEFRQELYDSDSEKYLDMSIEQVNTLFEEKYPKEIEEAQQHEINEALEYYRGQLESLNNTPDLFYYYSIDGRTLTNNEELNVALVKSNPVYFVIENHEIQTNIRLDRHAEYSYRYNYAPDKGDFIYLGFGEEYYQSFIDQWKADREYGVNYLRAILGQLSIILLCVIYLLIVAGKRSYDDDTHLMLFDRVFFEIQCGLFVLGFAGALSFFSYQDLISNSDYVLASTILSVIFAFSLGVVLSIAKHIKNKSFPNYILSYVILSWIVKFLRMIISSAPVALRMLPTPKKAYNLKNIINGTKHIKNGDLDYIIRSKGSGLYAELASDINNINEGLKASIDNELKSERLKTELITNVSHDIRTPLTSIITYIDLIKNEGLDSENAEKYVEVLENKAHRLKNLTDDLFEASKASTGNIPVTLENIDIVSLLNQGMGELEDKIEASGLDFRVKSPADRLIVRADGRLLWRVIENLMSNIFKYAMPSSRVYIDIVDNKHTVDVIIKNVSKYELNVNSDELMERFTRGEESRTSEGSGLGLNIAKSLIELQHGKFAIDIDGDLFKAKVTVLKAKKQVI